MSHSVIGFDVQSGIATVTFQRPDKRNALNDAMRAEFLEALGRVHADRAIRALVITGAGKGFCAGGDIAAMEQRMHAPAGEIAFNGWQRMQRVHHMQALLHTLPKPTLAAVNGAASGLGADIALACDFIVASAAASFSWSYIRRGLVADGGGMYFLPRRVGLPRAKELLFTGRAVGVDEALAIGLVDRATTAERLLDEARAWAAELCAASPTALALTKTILNQAYELPAEQVFAQGSQAQGICYTSDAHRESVQAFLAKTAAKP